MKIINDERELARFKLYILANGDWNKIKWNMTSIDKWDLIEEIVSIKLNNRKRNYLLTKIFRNHFFNKPPSLNWSEYLFREFYESDFLLELEPGDFVTETVLIRAAS